MKKKKYLLIALAVMTLVGAVPVYAENGWNRVPNQSSWKGTYYRSDGQRLTILDTEQDYVFYSFSDQWGEASMDMLGFTNEEKTQAKTMEGYGDPVYFTLNGNKISADNSQAQWKLFEGDYYRADGASCWQRQDDGSYVYLDENGQVAKNTVTPDGWYVGADGKWESWKGMAGIRPGLYQSIYRNPGDILSDEWSFDMFTSWEGDGLKDSSDRIWAGTVDYSAYDRNNNLFYTKKDMNVYNTMEGYVIEDLAGQTFAWLYPSGYYNHLMIQMYGSETYHAVQMVEDYSDFGG